MIPTNVANRLKLGRDVAAEVPAQNEGCRAWIYVKPLYGSGHLLSRISGSESEPITIGSLRGYQIRYIQVPISYLAFGFDLDRAWQDSLTMDERTEISTDEELEQAIRKHLTDLTALRIPSLVDYPWLPRKPNSMR